MRRFPYGPEAWLLDDVDDPTALAQAITALGHPDIVDVVPAEFTVTVRCRRSASAEIGHRLDEVTPVSSTLAADDTLVIDVVYDGDDLASVAAAIGADPQQVIERHVAAEYTVAFCGFSPGFGYLRGLDPALHLPRRSVPRTHVPAGSVAIAGGYSAVYPASTPGGWHLIGSTTATMWDTASVPPSPMQPGRRVRFRQVRG